MKTLKTKRIFVLIWIILALSVLASISVGFESLKHFSEFNSSSWVMLNRVANTCILIIISIKLWKIVKTYTDENKWQPHFYQKLRQIGYWCIVLTLISPSIEIAIQSSSLIIMPNPITHITSHQMVIYFVIFELCMKIFVVAMPMWVLTLNIFLFAELLRVANEVKAENESII